MGGGIMPPLVTLVVLKVEGQNLINSTLIDESIFPSVEKVSCVTPAFKKTDRLNKENYRPISVLNGFSSLATIFSQLDDSIPQ